MSRRLVTRPQAEDEIAQAAEWYDYSLVFTTSGEEIVILACPHERQHPRRWRSRR